MHRADLLFCQFKQQNELDSSHHQWKKPLAVHPIFLRTSRRVESLVQLLLIALLDCHLIQRLYQQGLELDAPVTEQRTPRETFLRAFKRYTARIKRRPMSKWSTSTNFPSDKEESYNG